MSRGIIAGRLGFLAAALLLLASSASRAAMVSGSFSFFPFTDGSYVGPNILNASSVTMAVPEYIGTALGDFSSYAYPDTLTMATLPTFPATGSLVTEPDAVPDLIQFTTNGSPSNQFQFDLTSLGEINSAGLVLYGTGTLRDTTGFYDPTPAQFTGNGFSDRGGGTFGGGSFTFAATAVPEPASIVPVIGIGTVLLLRRRRRIAL